MLIVRNRGKVSGGLSPASSQGEDMYGFMNPSIQHAKSQMVVPHSPAGIAASTTAATCHKVAPLLHTYICCHSSPPTQLIWPATVDLTQNEPVSFFFPETSNPVSLHAGRKVVTECTDNCSL